MAEAEPGVGQLILDALAVEDAFPEPALRQLGGILDNLEVALSHRKLLPMATVRRLSRAADLAFDLQQGLRLLAGERGLEIGTTVLD